jgi:DNA-binding winged helix-turn-helix (wHTH) protein
VELRILGPLEVADGTRLLALGAGRQRKLLAILLVRVNEVVSTDRLIHELWGDSPPESASKALQGYVSHLRRLLGRELLVTEPPGYALRIPAEQIDAAQFERLVSEARAAKAAERAERLRSALDLWRGAARRWPSSPTRSSPERKRGGSRSSGLPPRKRGSTPISSLACTPKSSGNSRLSSPRTPFASARERC